MILDSSSQRPEITYPCEWSFKVIGEDVDRILSAIGEASLGLDYDVIPSNLSKNGKYFSFNFKLEVQNEVVRNLIYEKLQSSPDIKFVI